MTTAAGWSAGYVTDTPYMRGYYPQQNPVHLALNTTMAGFNADRPGPDDPLHYLELGCGQGFGALVLAAANPAWRITAIDFNPGHVADARRVAGELGIGNIRFLEADLTTLAEDPLIAEIPQADVTSMHGVWSWVAPEVRAGIVRLLRARVRPGGLVHVSYNALPGWHSVLLLQRLIHRTGRHLARGSLAEATAGLAFARELAATGATGLASQGPLKDILEHLETSPAAYIAHEYMNDSWQPCWHADVAADLAGAKLDYVGSASILANFPDLMVNAEQRAILDRFTDPSLRELVLDSCQTRMLRHDIYARGARRVSVGVRDEALGGVTLALARAPKSFVYALKVPAGEAALNEAFYGPIVERLGRGPATVAELLAIGAEDGQARNAAEIIGTMVGSHQALVLARPGAAMNDASRRLNAHTATHSHQEDSARRPTALACPALAGGLVTPLAHIAIARRLAETPDADPAGIDTLTWARDAAPPEAQPAQIEEVATGMRGVLDEHARMWRWVGIA